MLRTTKLQNKKKMRLMIQLIMHTCSSTRFFYKNKPYKNFRLEVLIWFFWASSRRCPKVIRAC